MMTIPVQDGGANLTDSMVNRKRQQGRSVKPLRAGIVGTGYISGFHARAIRANKNAVLVGACDTDRSSAERFARDWGIEGFNSLETMLRASKVDVIHVLAPPDQHYNIASTALVAGAHVFIEKPMCTSAGEAEQLLRLAQDRGLEIGVNHNFLFASGYELLRRNVHSGVLGPIDHLVINHFFELGQIRSGPFNSWMLREPGNAILEIGPHLLSALLDLLGCPGDLAVTADNLVELPGGNQVYRRWRIKCAVGGAAVDVNINLGSGFSQRTIAAHGKVGTALFDLDANTCTIDRRTPLSMDLDRYRRSWRIAKQLRSQARKTLADYLLSTLKLRRRGSPYQSTITDSINTFYAALSSGTTLDGRVSGEAGRDVVFWCEKIVQEAGISPSSAPRQRNARSKNGIAPTVLVFGGTGFIGQELIRQLLAAGYGVRAVVRRSAAILEQLDAGRLDIVRGNISALDDLLEMMRGIEFVYHLARPTDAKSWKDYLERDIEPTRLIAEACLKAKVKRLIYTGTIASYYTGANAGTITERTSLDRNISRRDYYARSKAAAEALLMHLYQSQQLPVVIFRPGIVIGRNGTPFHWGVGMWVSEGVCRVWGNGRNPLPFVLVADVAAALVRAIEVKGIEGRSYNLVDLPLLTGREYLEELQRLTGTKVDIHYGSILQFYLADAMKWVVKLFVRHPDAHRIPSYRDWEARTHKAIFDCTRARGELNWKPTSDRARLIEEGICKAL